MASVYGYDLEYQDKDSPYLAQKKLYKGASQDYLEKAKEIEPKKWCLIENKSNSRTNKK